MYRYTFFDHNWAIKRADNTFIDLKKYLITGVTLDLGCGSAPFQEEIKEKCSTYAAIDWPQSAHACGANIFSDITKTLPIRDASIDTIIAMHVIEHIPEPLPFLEECNRVLSSGGYMISAIPFQWWEHEAPRDYYRLTQYGIRYLFEKAGFTIEYLNPSTGFWLMLQLKINYQTSRFTQGNSILSKALRALLIPFWLTSQITGLILDFFWTENRESAGYHVIAKKH